MSSNRKGRRALCSECHANPVKAKGKCYRCYKREYDQAKREVAYEERVWWREFKKEKKKRS